MQNETLGHRGRKSDPLYRCRRLLTKADERLDEPGRDKLLGLLDAGDPHGEVRAAWHAKEVVRSIYDHHDPDLADDFVSRLGHDLQDDSCPIEIRSHSSSYHAIFNCVSTKTGNEDVWVVVRCYNEASVVGTVITELNEFFQNVVGVDDGSSDGSDAVMRSCGARVVRHSINLGAGAALQTGIEFALKDAQMRYLVCFDADRQHRVADARAMVDHVRLTELDVLIGSRFLGGKQEIPLSRRWILLAGRFFERVTSGVSLTDAHNGLRVLSRRFLSDVELTAADMSYASELLVAIRRSGMRFAEFPVEIRYDEYSLAKGQKSINSVNIAMDTLLRSLAGRRCP